MSRLEVSHVTYGSRHGGKTKPRMKPHGIGWTFVVIGPVLAISAAVAGTHFYIARELVFELLFFCILFAATGIAVAILFVIDEVASRAFLWLRAQIVWAHFHLRHAASARGVVSAIHKF
jgi:hypothetical protein